jgi:two-component system, chemotaxis family, protein-glutamate methylesterase/glutaminase
MFGNRLIVIGASAGGVEALKELVTYLPADLTACILVVLHVPPHSASMLPAILSRSGQLPAIHPKDGQTFEQGYIFVAPPDKHMLVKDGYLSLVRGPHENGHRPAVDPLFRTAARVYSNDVIGVVLSGALDDGTAGLAVIKQRGGITIAQDPQEALYAGMPSSAIENVQVDYVLSLREIALKLSELAQSKPIRLDTSVSSKIEYETEVEEFDMAAIEDGNRPGVPSSFVCPDCGGTLWEIVEGDVLRYRCHVGHAFSVETLRSEQAEALETALWVALRSLEDSATLAHRLTERSRSRNHIRAAERFEDEAQKAEQSARIIRDVLLAGITDGEKKTISEE